MKRKGEAVFAASFFVRRRKVSNAYGKTDAIQSSPQSQNDASAAFCIGRKKRNLYIGRYSALQTALRLKKRLAVFNVGVLTLPLNPHPFADLVTLSKAGGAPYA
ncbi:MAG: hypothetical protein IJY86_11270 [Clostridia bacterium]|nr:hypothetical protein [Clostridia bacterium]MBQ8899029.1 hypothetical protein [Clostridia bacterium]